MRSMIFLKYICWIIILLTGENVNSEEIFPWRGSTVDDSILLDPVVCGNFIVEKSLPTLVSSVETAVEWLIAVEESIGALVVSIVVEFVEVNGSIDK